MRTRNSAKPLDQALSRYDSSVLETKHRQAADYVRELEQALRRAKDLQQMIRHPVRPLNPVTIHETFPSVMRTIVSAAGAPPSYLSDEWELLKGESKPILTQISQHLQAVKDFLVLPRATWREPIDAAHPSAPLDAGINAYLSLVENCLTLHRELRDRLAWTLNALATTPKASPRARDQALRDQRIHELANENPEANHAGLFKIAQGDVRMKEILARGYTMLKTKETIRNVLKPRKGGKSNGPFTASRGQPREKRHRIGH